MVKKKKPTKSTKRKVKTLKSETSFKTDKDLAIDFATKAHERFDRIIKASILFGSVSKGTASSKSDVDVILIIDDAGINWDLELIAWYREELGKLISAQKYSRKLHINSIKLTTWWQDLLNGDPVVTNILRYGQALIDSGGFFNPLKALLLDGKIKSTPEAVHAALQRAPSHLARSKMAQMSAIEGVYWCMVDSAQAALMSAGKRPPSPERIPQLLKESFVNEGLLKMNSVRAMSDLYSLHKMIAHGKMHDIKGTDIDAWQGTAEKFLLEMTKIINVMIERQK